jgi:hypothetical protein
VSLSDFHPSEIIGGECSKLPPEEMDEIFFPGEAAPSRVPSAAVQREWNKAKLVCADCAWLLKCRDAAWGEVWGVWGGTDPHQRSAERRRRALALLRLAPEERAELAAALYALHAGGNGLPIPVIAARRGLSISTVSDLVDEHREVLEALRVAAALEREKAMAAVSGTWRDTPQWPAGAPGGIADCWVWRDQRAFSGVYVSQTEDGAYLRCKFRTDRRSPVIKWFPKDLVQIRKSIDVQVETWAGRKADAA